MTVRQIVIMVSAGVIFLLCLVGCVIAYRAYSEAANVHATLDGTVGNLKKIYNENPFPSQTNMAVLRTDTAWLTNWRQSLTDELHTAIVLTDIPTPPAFSRKMQRESIPALQKMAVEKGCKLGDNFAFGFDWYLGNIPKLENVKRLTLQFAMIEAISKELFESHVTELTQVQRQDFEGNTAGESSTPSRGRSRSAPTATSSKQQLDGIAYNRYAGEELVFAFKADEKALIELLNRLAKIPMFVVVRDLAIKREKPGLQLFPEKTTAETDKTKNAALLPSQRMASGPEIAPLLEIKMHIDVYTFEGV